jgi:hypothetical protein
MTEKFEARPAQQDMRIKALETRILKAGARLDGLKDKADSLSADDIPRLIELVRTVIREIAECTTDPAMLAGLKIEQAERARAEILNACAKWEADIVAFLGLTWQAMERHRGQHGEMPLRRQ